MIQAGLATVVVLVVGTAVWWRRRSADSRDGVFRCGIRFVGDRDGSPWRPRRRAHAHWVHDVLIVDRGLLHRTTRALPVRTVHGFLDPSITGAKFERSISVRIELDDGSIVEIQAAADSIDSIGGPFLAAHPTLRGSTR
jgi:hypothetical protein